MNVNVFLLVLLSGYQAFRGLLYKLNLIIITIYLSSAAVFLTFFNWKFFAQHMGLLSSEPFQVQICSCHIIRYSQWMSSEKAIMLHTSSCVTPFSRPLHMDFSRHMKNHASHPIVKPYMEPCDLCPQFIVKMCDLVNFQEHKMLTSLY